MSLPIVTSSPKTTTVNLGNGFTSTTTYEYNSNSMPSNITTNTYQNGVLSNVDTQTFTYQNGVETVNWTDTSKTFNTSSSGTFTSEY